MKKKGMVFGRAPLTFANEQPEPPEWSVVQEVLAASLASRQQDWAAFSTCQQIEIYTDGSTPIVNPGGPSGFSAVIVGYTQRLDPTTADRPQPVARLNLAGYLPARITDPKTSNNRAELAGVMAALAALPYLNLSSYTAMEIVIWSDSDVTIKCGTGEWKRKKNVDMWLVFDGLYREIKDQLPIPVKLKWLKGHAGNKFNEAADEMATLAGLNFDQGRLDQLRAAQTASGKEMPGTTAPEQPAGPAQGKDKTPSSSVTDYSVVLATDLDNRASASGGPATGHYLLQTRNGQRALGTVAHPQVVSSDEAEYRTLLSALRELIGRIETKGKEPGGFTLQVVSFRELMINQLLGTYRVRASTLVPLHMEAKGFLGRFRNVELVWRPSAEVRRLMMAGTPQPDR